MSYWFMFSLKYDVLRVTFEKSKKQERDRNVFFFYCGLCAFRMKRSRWCFSIYTLCQSLSPCSRHAIVETFFPPFFARFVDTVNRLCTRNVDFFPFCAPNLAWPLSLPLPPTVTQVVLIRHSCTWSATWVRWPLSPMKYELAAISPYTLTESTANEPLLKWRVMFFHTLSFHWKFIDLCFKVHYYYMLTFCFWKSQWITHRWKTYRSRDDYILFRGNPEDMGSST